MSTKESKSEQTLDQLLAETRVKQHSLIAGFEKFSQYAAKPDSKSADGLPLFEACVTAIREFIVAGYNFRERLDAAIQRTDQRMREAPGVGAGLAVAQKLKNMKEHQTKLHDALNYVLDAAYAIAQWYKPLPESTKKSLFENTGQEANRRFLLPMLVCIDAQEVGEEDPIEYLADIALGNRKYGNRSEEFMSSHHSR